MITSTPRQTPNSHNKCDEGFADSDQLPSEQMLCVVGNANERLVAKRTSRVAIA